MEQILDIIRNPKNPPKDLDEVAARAKRRKKFDGEAPSRSLLYKVRRYLTDTERAKYFPGADG